MGTNKETMNDCARQKRARHTYWRRIKYLGSNDISNLVALATLYEVK